MAAHTPDASKGESKGARPGDAFYRGYESLLNLFGYGYLVRVTDEDDASEEPVDDGADDAVEEPVEEAHDGEPHHHGEPHRPSDALGQPHHHGDAVGEPHRPHDAVGQPAEAAALAAGLAIVITHREWQDQFCLPF